MLARAARRKLRRDAFRPPPTVADQLTLPWLCPAQMRWAASVASTPNTPCEPRQQHPSTSWRAPASLSPRHETRSLATTADVAHSRHGSIPFHGMAQAWSSRLPDPELSKLHLWDTSKPLVINDSSIASPITPIKYGIGGDPVELHQNLYACLRVGRIDRATAIIQRLTSMYVPSAPEVVDAHNVFLQALLEHAQHNPSATSMADIEDWYKKQMVGKTIEPNAQTFVTLLRASMNFLDKGAQEESIRKYLALAHDSGPSVLDEVNASPDFSDEEWDTLIRFQPDIFDEPPAVDDVQNLQISTPAGQALAIQHGLIPDPALAVKAVPQKGLGLSSLKKALSSFELGQDVPYPHEMEGSQADKDRAYAYMRQIRVEQDAAIAATERWKAEDAKLQEIGIHGVLQSKPVQALMWNWYSALLPRLQKEIQAAKDVMSAPSEDNQRNERHIYGPYLEQCDAEKLAALTISRVISATAQSNGQESGLKLAVLTIKLGRDIEDEVNHNAKSRHDAFLRKKRSRARKELLARLSKEKAEFGASEMPTVTTPPSVHASDTLERKHFPLHIKTKIGALALEHLMQSAMITVTRDDPKTGKKVTSTQPAFGQHTGFLHGKKIGWIAPHRVILEKLRTEPVHNITVAKLPMLVEPKPWTHFDEGGYYTVKDHVMRTRLGDLSQRAYAISAIEKGDMNKIMAGLDVLGKVPWNINGAVFRVMVEAWNSGEAIGGLIPEHSGPQRPPDPAPDATYEERLKWGKKMKEYDNVRSGQHSQRCFHNFQLEIARAYLNERFYYPHSVDFRGRAYPVPPLFNHIGADLSRSLLKFANGKELGAVGLQWLKVHLANLYGFDKASLRDREQFAMDNLNEIYDSATNPLGGKRWWAKAEDPWQCLACCIELKNALDSPDPARFVSQLPVHQDGTCNGLQHYAALGGDEAGANQVNLEPSDRPQDIYTGVAELVKEFIAEDAAKGEPYAKFLKGAITRRVVKRTVMTNVYGVTFLGAKLQVLDELKQIFPNFQETKEIPSLSPVAMYIAKKIFMAIGKIFNGAQEIQYWLGECGDRITTSISAEQIRNLRERQQGKRMSYDAKYKQPKTTSDRVQKKLDKQAETFKTSIIWTTPLKMPVVQPYRKDTLKVIPTSIQNITLATNSSTDTIDKRKQLQAFPPNFIHSLDASHMILSALKCSELGLDFAAVHDSFWTHAADIPNLNIVLRDAFVRMHSEDIIGRLAAEFQARYAGAMYCAKLKAAAPVARRITAWRAQQRSERDSLLAGRRGDATIDEVALEATRQELLESEDEEERKRGAEMVTPTSIWLAAQDPKALSSYRLALLGDMKGKAKLEKVKNKVLGAEAEAVRKGSASADVEAAAEEATAESDDLAQDTTTEEAVEVPTTKRTRKHASKPLGSSLNDYELEEEAEPSALDPEKAGTRKTKRSTEPSTIRVWIPLTFPPVPKRGNWDVKRLRESKYFFS